MRRNGFTLIELLAVIVILAIIALIATPIILGIISDAKKQSQERSAELYLSGVELAIARRNLTEEFNPSECTIEDGKVSCTVNEEKKELEVEVDGEVPIDGTIVFQNNKAINGTELKFEGFTATINGSGKVEVSNSSQQGPTIEVGKLDSVCKPYNEQPFATDPLDPGYKYECDVDPTKEGYDYTFYVLNSDGSTVNLIMDSNINENGQAIKSGVANKGFYWLNSDDYSTAGGTNDAANLYGPITLMKTLSDITKNWTNANLIVVDKFDVCDDNGVCADEDMIMYEEYETGVYARVPYYEEMEDYSVDKNNAYLYDNMFLFCHYRGEEKPCNEEGVTIIGIYDKNISHAEPGAYWTLSAYDAIAHYAWVVYDDGFGTMQNEYPGLNGAGIRPVINLDI